MSSREAFAQAAVLEAWGAHPQVRIVRMNTGAGFPPHSKQLVKFGVPGTGDIVGIIRGSGRMVQIEMKSLTGKQRKAQEVMQRVITEFGGLYFVARSLADVDREFAKLGIHR